MKKTFVILSIPLINLIYAGIIFSIIVFTSSDGVLTMQSWMQHNFERFFWSILFGPWAHDYTQIIMDNPYESFILSIRVIHGLITAAILYIFSRMVSIKASIILYIVGNVFLMMAVTIGIILYLQTIVQSFSA